MLLAPTPALDWNDAAIAWQPWEQGFAQAREQRRPLLLLLYTRDCVHGPAYSRLFHAADVVAQARRFVMVRADADVERELDARFMPDGSYVPRTIFLSPDGEPAYALQGSDRSYPHFLDTESPSELLLLMRAAERALADPSRPPGSP